MSNAATPMPTPTPTPEGGDDSENWYENTTTMAIIIAVMFIVFLAIVIKSCLFFKNNRIAKTGRIDKIADHDGIEINVGHTVRNAILNDDKFEFKKAGYEGSTTRSVRSVRSARSASRSHTPAPAPTTSQNYPNQGPALDTDTIDSELGAQHIDPFVKQQHDAHDSDNDSDLSIDYDTELEPKFVEITELKHNHRAAPSHASEIEPQAPSGGRFLMRPNRARGAPRRGVVNDSKHARARSSGSIPNKDDANRRFAASGNVLSPHSDMGARPSDVPPPNIAPSPAPPIDSESAPMPKPDVLPPPVPSNGEVGMMAMPSSAVKVPLPPTDRDLSDSDTENYTQVSYVN